MRLRVAPSAANKRIWIAALLAWVGLVTFGGAKLVIYGATPGSPATLSSVSAGRRFHLYVFFHPLCACSASSLSELVRLQQHGRAPLDVIAIIDNAGFTAATAKPMVDRLQAIPGMAVELDADGTATAAFGARTSGQILLYDPKGDLVFSGGITESRAHEGDNVGDRAILSILAGNRPAVRHTPTFGCALSPAVNRR